MIDVVRGVIVCSFLLWPIQANAWKAVEVISGQIIKVTHPSTKKDLHRKDSNQIRYRFDGESKYRIGLITDWTTHCQGPYCHSLYEPSFRLETFSKHGVLYFVPLLE